MNMKKMYQNQVFPNYFNQTATRSNHPLAAPNRDGYNNQELMRVPDALSSQLISKLPGQFIGHKLVI